MRERLFAHFYGLGDPDLQNAFLREHMDVKARPHVPETTITMNPATGRSPRRITCKYLVPLLPSDQTADVCQKAFVSAFVITTKRVRLQREKLISSLGLNSYGKNAKSPVPPGKMKNINNNDVEAISRVSEDDEAESETEASPKRRVPRRPVNDPLIPWGLWVPDGLTIAPVTATPDHDRDIAIVNNFFSNQLWKPEYIGTYS